MNITSTPFITIARFPRNARCAITTSWDDNDCRNLEVMHILDSMKMKGTFYIDPGGMCRKRNVYVDQYGKPRSYKDGLTEAQLRTLAENHEVGSHTWSHPITVRCDSRKLREELDRSKEYIEHVSGLPVIGISYPHGVCSPPFESLSRECGYMFARTTRQGDIEFPPSNPYQWSISVFARDRTPSFLKGFFSRRSVISPVGNAYLRNLAFNWRTLSLRLFEKARSTHGVLHIFGHASEVLRPRLRTQFLSLCNRLAFRNDVWYATNGMLFLNEIMRKSIRVSQTHGNNRSVFVVRASPRLPRLSEEIPMSFVLEAPRLWQGEFTVDIASSSGRTELKKVSSYATINIFDCKAEIIISRT